MRKDIKEIGTSYHEAGHAVISFFEYIPFDYVTIIPDDDSLGHVFKLNSFEDIPLATGDFDIDIDSVDNYDELD